MHLDYTVYTDDKGNTGRVARSWNREEKKVSAIRTRLTAAETSTRANFIFDGGASHNLGFSPVAPYCLAAFVEIKAEKR